MHDTFRINNFRKFCKKLFLSMKSPNEIKELVIFGTLKPSRNSIYKNTKLTSYHGRFGISLRLKCSLWNTVSVLTECRLRNIQIKNYFKVKFDSCRKLGHARNYRDLTARHFSRYDMSVQCTFYILLICSSPDGHFNNLHFCSCAILN